MAEIPEEVELTVGEVRTLPLEGSGGGYRWHAEVEGDDGVVEVTTDYAEGEPPKGSWRGELATLTGLAPGSASIRLVHRRLWESSPRGGGQVVRVTVRPE